MSDQTDPGWLKDSNAETLGTGVFLISVDNPGIRKIFVRDITYQDCVLLGRSATEFKWVPSYVAEYAQLTQIPCGQSCVETCTPPGCVCDRAARTCR
jgi:hypothetical protein